MAWQLQETTKGGRSNGQSNKFITYETELQILILYSPSKSIRDILQKKETKSRRDIENTLLMEKDQNSISRDVARSYSYTDRDITQSFYKILKK